MNLVILCILIALINADETPDSLKYISTTDIENYDGGGINTKLALRKCCANYEYYNTETHKCTVIDNDDIFKAEVKRKLLNLNNQTFKIYPGKIHACPKTNQKPDYVDILGPSSYSLLQNGDIRDNEKKVSFDHSHYCLEMVGSKINNASLGIAYCIKPHEIVPKCCKEGHYFDLRVYDCSPFHSNKKNEDNSKLLAYLSKDSELAYEKELHCNDSPMKISLSETTLFDNILCVTKMNQCLNVNEFCIDNMLEENENQLTQSAFVCTESFISKCCPDKMSLYKGGCMKTPRSSLFLTYILNSMRYQVKGVSQMNSHCNPIIIEESTRSKIPWTINSYGVAEITSTNDTVIKTSNYCIDDFSHENEIFPVIKVCSEEVKMYHKVSLTKDLFSNKLGKCCPGDQFFRSNSEENSLSQCIKKEEDINMLQEKFLRRYNISQLVYTSFPKCSDTKYYHKYELEYAERDYTELTEDGNLKIIRIDNGCKIRETQIDASEFCFDFVLRSDGSTKPMTIVCVPTKNSHPERNAIVVALVGVSCTALMSSFYSLLFMRVRRGMVTMKKINTLAGRILTSYVVSQLIGYFILCIGVLAEFEEGAIGCVIVAGFLMFFWISAFCWNTSICLEGFLLTLHIKVSEARRYFFHSVWAWGIPAIFTGVAFINDYRRDSCNSITPKFGVERCFFSDPVAQLVYFYFPIGFTVIVNSFLLISSKIIRWRKLKNLEKDPNRERTHQTLQQVLSIKSIKSKIRGEPSLKPISDHSGLRTHHNRNTLLESLRLVLWSGTSWIMEVVGTLVTMFLGRSKGEWYNYLWYFPMGFNCLRGFGIFVIISLNAENKTFVLKTVNALSTRIVTFLGRFHPTNQRGFPSKSGWRGKARRNGRTDNCAFSSPAEKPNANAISEKEEKPRSTSVTTIITNLSSSSVGTISSEVVRNQSESEHPPRLFYYSISQLDMQPPLPEMFECSGEDNDPNIAIKKEDENASLDNTSMEEVFLNEQFKKMRDNSHNEQKVGVWKRDSNMWDEKEKIDDPTTFSNTNMHKKEDNITDETSSEIKKNNYTNFYYCTRL